VEDQPGITRDSIAADVEVGGRSILLVDTAGLEPDAEQGLPAAIQAQAWSAVEDADAVLFVVDGRAGLLPEDESLARTLRRSSKPIGVAVNKIDRPQHEPLVAEFHGLGFECVTGVSAEHGRGAWDALEALVAQLPPGGETTEEAAEGVRAALVGRPNVGKSSLLNRLSGQERVVVSDVPGTTRDSIDTRIEVGDQVITLVDTSGLRRPGRRERPAERGSALMTVRALERAQVALLVIDAGEGFTDQDARVARLARERGCPTGVLANKWDRVTASGEEDRPRRVREAISHGLRFMRDAPVLPVSAKTGAGIGRVWALVRRLADVGERSIPTSVLNRWLEETVARHDPGMAQRGFRRRPLKFFYATQTAVRPPTFVLFCSEPEAVQPSYRRFLENRLRETFDLEGTPVRLRLRAREH
jgi:GTP-binding protein